MASGSTDPLLPRAGAARHRPATGGWRSALFIIWVEVAERFAYYGVSSNLISYLTGPFGETTAAAAAAVNAWSGAASMLPLLGAAVADSWLGRYRTIVASSVLYITGLGLLALSSTFSSPQSQQCSSSGDGRQVCRSSSVQRAFFYVSLYLVAIAQSGHKPCVQAFGADQFDATDPGESSSRSTFFNWWYLGLCASATVTAAVMSYVQDNVGWGLGFGVPGMVMLLGLLVFLLGTRTYRFYDGGGSGAFSGVGEAVRAWRKSRRRGEGGGGGGATVEAEHGELAEEVRGMARLFPIWATCLLYGVLFAQPPTLFTKQAATLDRRIGPSSSFQVPPAALQSFLGVSIIPCVLLYEHVLVPAARRATGVATGITMLQRIGAGIAMCAVTLLVAALVEMRRLSAARDADPGAAVPMSLWWMVPQYVLFGAADVFAMVGMQEFFYDQVPGALKSLGLALYLSVLGVGSFISSFLISAIDVVTRRDGGTSWFDDDLNRGHLDYFYLLLAALTVLDLLAYVYFSMSYIYRRKVVDVQ
uniref:Major facilitator superfamily (MFS) profile domain-containing protein n=1 Tax=Oryza nivara TaxID=4536 RepID=A0A0E0HEX1_ORYNI